MTTFFHLHLDTPMVRFIDVNPFDCPPCWETAGILAVTAFVLFAARVALSKD